MVEVLLPPDILGDLLFIQAHGSDIAHFGRYMMSIGARRPNPG